MDSQEKELREKIRPIMENMVFQLVCEKPESPVQLLINYYKKFKLKGYVYDKLVTKARRLHFKW